MSTGRGLVHRIGKYSTATAVIHTSNALFMNAMVDLQLKYLVIGNYGRVPGHRHVCSIYWSVLGSTS